MKPKNYKLIALLFISHVIFSQNTVPNSGEVYFDTNLKVGGQIAPASTAGEIVRLSLRPYGHTGGPWNFKTRDNSSFAFLDIDYGTTGSAITFTSDKKIGINSQMPLNTFEVKVATSTGTSSSDGISIHDGTVNRLGINIGVNTAGEYSFLQAVKGGIGQKNIAINPTGGNVGIGIVAPVSKLSVAGSLTLGGGVGNNTLPRPLITAGTLPNGEIRGYSGAGNAYDDGFLRLSGGGGTTSSVKTFIDLSGYSTVPDMNGNIVFGTYGTERMRIDRNGYVSIGTKAPDALLTVNGTIHSSEVKVNLNFPAPDYVFAPDYKLRSLQEVENYIKENSHLPEIPSAKEFEKNGINVSEMNMALLKKVEELTLYSIQQQKNTEKLYLYIDEQQKRYDELTLQLKKQNERLEKLEKKNNN